MEPDNGSYDFGFDAMLRGQTEISRRTLLTTAGKFGALLGGAALLSACGGGGLRHSSKSSSQQVGLAALQGGTPVRGGTFTVGAVSGGQSENLFPGTQSLVGDFVRDYSLYSLLFYLGVDIDPLVPGLALSAESNADATVWTFKLRDGVEWHDGKPFSADDVVYNFKSLWSDPTQNYSAGFIAGLVDLRKVRKVNRLTVEVPLHKPVAQFPSILTYGTFGVVQDGATAKSTAARPIGTGPFKYESFTPGRRSVFSANKSYWEQGKPYVDRLVVDSSFTDPNAIFNAMLAGSINLYPTLPLATARQQLTSKQVQILQSKTAAQSYDFPMRVDKGPFADNRVRQGFKLLVDRQAMIDTAFSGFGSVGNDALAPGTQYYAANIKPVHDVDRAKSLFKAAGVLGHTFNLPACNAQPGLAESAAVLAQQATAAGIKVQVNTTSAATYFTPAGGFLTRPFSVSTTQVYGSLTACYLSALTTNCAYPETHWGAQPGGAAAEALISQAIAATDPATAQRLWSKCQQQQIDEGGYVNWGYLPYVDAAANNVRGLQAGAGFSYNNFRLCDGWIAS